MGRERLVTDPAGVAWEIYREDDDALAAILEWGHRAAGGDAGLIFSSRSGMKRLFPCPLDWETMSDAQLLELCDKATLLY